MSTQAPAPYGAASWGTSRGIASTACVATSLLAGPAQIGGQGMPEVRTKMMPVRQARSESRGLTPLGFGGLGGQQ
jgi:hypothetical protein